MMIKKYNINCSHVSSAAVLALIINSMGLTYTRYDTNDPMFDTFERLGIIGDEVVGTDVMCNVCLTRFSSVVTHAEVTCPNCDHKSYVEPD